MSNGPDVVLANVYLETSVVNFQCFHIPCFAVDLVNTIKLVTNYRTWMYTDFIKLENDFSNPVDLSLLVLWY